MDETGDGLAEHEDQGSDEKSGDQQGAQQGIIDVLFRVFALDEAEIGRFKPKQDNDIQKRDQGIDQAHLTITGPAGEFCRQVGCQQVIKKAGQNGACSVPDRLPR